MKIPTPYGYVIFCDDRRQESNGKEIFIGVYNDLLLIPKLPVALSKLMVVVRYIEEQGENDKPVHIKITTPGRGADKPLFFEPLPIDELREKAAKGARSNDDRVIAKALCKLAPFPMTEEGDVCVTAETDGKEIELGRLTIQVKPKTID